MISLAVQFNQIQWREPLWLLIGLQPILVYLLRYALQTRQHLQYADKQLLPWVIIHSNKPTKRRILHKLFSKNSAYILAWVLFAITAAGPRIALEIPGQKSANATDIMLVVDISRSMQATDVSPNRLRRAQIEIAELLERTQGNRIGIIVFSARPHLYVPLTSDYTALRFYLKSLDELVLPTMGSQPAAALKLARQELIASKANLNGTLKPESAIIMLSDGDWHDLTSLETQRLEKESTALNQANISVNTLGVATQEGSAIPLTKVFDKTGWLKYKGQSIVSRMDETKLRQLAENTGGRYSQVNNTDSDWVTIYDHNILKRDTSSLNNMPEEKIIWHELYSWALAPAILFLWISIIPYGLRSRQSSLIPRRSISTSLVLAISLVFMLIPLRQVNANELENQAYKNYVRNDYNAALDLYKSISGYIGRLGEGSSLYQSDDFKGAVQQFTQAVLEAKNDSNRATGLYNLGNSYFKLGDYYSAVTVYKDALAYQPNHKASRHNLLFSEALLKAVEERLGPTAGTNRTGTGPIQSRVDSGLEVNEQAAISVDDSQEALPKALSLPELPNLSKSIMQSLVNRGLQYIKLADGSSGIRSNYEQRLTSLAQSNARVRMKELEDRQPLLWKRMFEIEEGFAAPQDKPTEVPGVAPW